MRVEPEQDEEYQDDCYQCGDPADYCCADCGLNLCEQCAGLYGKPGDVDSLCEQCYE